MNNSLKVLFSFSFFCSFFIKKNRLYSMLILSDIWLVMMVYYTSLGTAVDHCKRFSFISIPCTANISHKPLAGNVRIEVVTAPKRARVQKESFVVARGRKRGNYVWGAKHPLLYKVFPALQDRRYGAVTIPFQYILT